MHAPSALPWRLFFVSNFVVLLFVGAFIGFMEIRVREDAAIERLARERATEIDREERERLVRELRAIQAAVRDIEPMQPPDNNKLFTVVTKGLGVSENVVATSQVGTTPTAAFATDLTTAQQTDAYTQEIIIANRDDTDVLCFKPIAWASAGANCAAKCAAQTITCPAVSGAGTTATDGTVTPPGIAWPRRYDGTSCICIVGSAADTAYQTERVIR